MSDVNGKILVQAGTTQQEEREMAALSTIGYSEVQDFVTRPRQVRACIWEGQDPDPNTGARKGQVIVHREDSFEVMDPDVFADLYQEPPPYYLGLVKMAVGESRRDGKRMAFVGTPQEVCDDQEEYMKANPTHMFCDEKVVPLGSVSGSPYDSLICSLVLVDRIGREEAAQYARELRIQARVRDELKKEEADQLAKKPKLLEAARLAVAEAQARLKKEQEALRADAAVAAACRKNHGKAKGRK